MTQIINKFSVISLMALFFGLLPLRLMAQEAAQGPDIHQLLSKGINFDHVFSPYQGEGDPNLTFGEKERAEMEKALQESQFKQLAELGVTHIRLNLGRAFIQEKQEPYHLRPEGLVLLDKAVDYALKNGLGIIIDMHQIPPPQLIKDKKAMDAFREMWKELAAHYTKKSSKIIFELLNEPVQEGLVDTVQSKESDWEKWRNVVKDLVNTIHGEDSGRYVIITGAGWGGVDGLMRMGNLHLSRVVYTFHDYNPMFFTHQGATWSDKVLAMLRNIHYPIVPDEVKKWAKKAEEQHFDDWPFKEVANGYDKESMRKDIKAVADFGKREGILLYCGEFGVHKPYAPPESRARWISDFVSVLNENNIAWSMWCYHSGFDLVDEKGKPDMAIVKALGLKGK